MLRREFLQAVAGFLAAASAAKAALAAAGPAALSECRCGAAQPPAGVDLDEVSTFEKTIMSCLRDGSLSLVGVSGCGAGYEAFYRPGNCHIERLRHESLMAMYDRGMIVVDDVTVWNNYDAFSIRFAICTNVR